jgi:hypothetical protein
MERESGFEMAREKGFEWRASLLGERRSLGCKPRAPKPRINQYWSSAATVVCTTGVGCS